MSPAPRVMKNAMDFRRPATTMCSATNARECTRMNGNHLMRTAATQHLRNRSQNNLPVQRQRPAVDVLHVEPHPGFEVDGIAAAHRPQACQTGAHPKTAPLPAFILIHFFGNRGPRRSEE